TGQQPGEGLDEFGKVAGEGLRLAGSALKGVTVPCDEPAEAVPLRLEQHSAGVACRMRDSCCVLREPRRWFRIAHVASFVALACPGKGVRMSVETNGCPPKTAVRASVRENVLTSVASGAAVAHARRRSCDP